MPAARLDLDGQAGIGMGGIKGKGQSAVLAQVVGFDLFAGRIDTRTSPDTGMRPVENLASTTTLPSSTKAKTFN